MYSRIIDGQEYTFGVSGKLIRNVLVMYDRQTNTLWSQLIGQAVEGELEGSKLGFMPSLQTTWADWVARYPHTLALRKGFYGNNDSYEGYYLSPSAGVIGQTLQDDRLQTKEFVLGVERDGAAVAYPFSVLNEIPVLNDRVGETDILVVFNDKIGSGVVFNRELDGQILTFSVGEGMMLFDEQTGSLWNGLTGVSVDGPLAGAALERVKSTSSFWFGWKDWFPDSKIYGLDG